MTAETLNGASLHDEMAYPDCLLTKNSLKDVWEWLSELSTMFNSCTSQSRFCAAISLINPTVSADIFGLEEAALDVYFQNSRNPWRCQRRSVSGWIMKSACFQVEPSLREVP